VNTDARAHARHKGLVLTRTRVKKPKPVASALVAGRGDGGTQAVIDARIHDARENDVAMTHT
jgi:hypothetical protein